MIQHVQYDNNLYSAIGSRAFSEIISKENELGIMPFANPYVLRELMYHLSGDTPLVRREQCIRAIRKLFQHCMRGGQLHMLPNIEMQLLEVFFNISIGSNLEELNFVHGLICINKPITEWPKETLEFLARQRADKERLEREFFASHAEIQLAFKTEPLIKAILKPNQPTAYKRAARGIVDELVHFESGVRNERVLKLAAEELERVFKERSEGEAAKFIPLKAAEILKGVATSNGLNTPDSYIQLILDPFVEVFRLPLRFEYEARRDAMLEGRKNVNDVDDTFILYSCCKFAGSSPPPVTLVTDDMRLVRTSEAHAKGKVWHIDDYLDFLGLPQHRIVRVDNAASRNRRSNGGSKAGRGSNK